MSSNFDIGKKRLENVAKPEENFDVVNKEFFDMRYDFLHEMDERSQLRGSTTFRYFFIIIIEPRGLIFGMRV